MDRRGEVYCRASKTISLSDQLKGGQTAGFGPIPIHQTQETLSSNR